MSLWVDARAASQYFTRLSLIGWHLSFLYYALFFWASTYHYVLSHSLNHYRNEYLIDVKRKNPLEYFTEGSCFLFFLTASGKYQSNNVNNEWFVGWHLSFLYYALFFWASTYHYVLSYSLNHYRNEYLVDVKEKEFSWVFYWRVM